MSLRSCFWGSAFLMALSLTGCGANKGSEKGNDENLKIATQAGGATRPALPSKAGGKTDGKTLPNAGGNPAGKGPPPAPFKK